MKPATPPVACFNIERDIPPFSPKQEDYKPWRNYARTFKSMGLVYQKGEAAEPTEIANLLADDGSITTDEYFHFLAEYTSSPSPALKGWDSSAELRYPLSTGHLGITMEAWGYP